MGLLGDIFSTIDSTKRRVGAFVSDPAGSTEQSFANFRDNYEKLLSLQDTAYLNKSVLLTPQEKQQARAELADYGSNIGLAGMTKGSMDGVFKYSQDKAIEQARKNGVKMLGLPEGNTALDRAKAMGFDTNYQALHGTAASTNFKQFKAGTSGVDELGQGVYVTDRPFNANGFTNGDKPRVMPLMVKDGVLFDKANKIDYLELAQKVKANNKFLSESDSMLAPPSELWRSWLNESDKDLADFIKSGSKYKGDNAWLNRAGYTGAMTSGAQQMPNQRVIFNPADIRSRFAAFDPARASENDLLGRASPGLLGLIGVGAGGAAYVNKDK